MSLFIKKYKYKNGKIYCSIVDGYRINGKVKQSVVQKYGYISDLENIYDLVELCTKVLSDNPLFFLINSE